MARRHFDALEKRPVRRALGEEQQGLCVFCETRIDAERGFSSSVGVRPSTSSQEAVLPGVRVAHWKPVSVDPAAALEWTNVYASCSGTWPSGAQTCDAHQGERDPDLAPPSARDWGDHLEFGTDGTVKPRAGAPAALEKAIPVPPERGLWSLNHPSLIAARRAAVDAELERAKWERDRRREPKRPVIERALQRLERTPLEPFVTARRQALRRWLNPPTPAA